MNRVLFYSTRLKAGQSSNQHMLRFVHIRTRWSPEIQRDAEAEAEWAGDIRMSSFADCINLTEWEGLTDHLICGSCRHVFM
jgi:hypothetical protein